jgi:uncharacterized membrane protein
MAEPLLYSISLLIKGLEIFGAIFLIIGFAIDTVRWFWHKRQQGSFDARHRYRQSLGRSVLIGLEILVAATIIKTIIVEPSVEGVSLLAGMIIIRTILGWTTVLEVSGRWPWQRM